MRRLLGFDKTLLKARVVLVVTSRDISWYRYENLKITNRLRHSYDQEASIIVESCQWLKKYIDGKEATIELVVDTELDDLDRVKLIDSTQQFGSSWSIRKVLRQLRREYPHAAVSSLPKFLYPEIGSVLYSQLADQSSAWLEKLDECGVVVSHVVTATELFLAAFQYCPSPVLLYMYDGRNRHRLLLAVDGLPLHMRQVVATGSSENNKTFSESYLSDTLIHLSVSAFSSLSELMLVLPREINSSEQAEFPDEYLAKQYLRLPCDFPCRRISLSPESEQVASSLMCLDSLEKESLSGYSREKPHTILNSIIKPLPTERKCAQYEVGRRFAKFPDVFSHSIATMKQRQHAFILRRCTLLVFLTFMFLVLATSRAGVQSFQGQKQAIAEHHSLKADVLELEDKAATLHQSPFYVMESINRIQDFQEVEIPNPQKIISTVSAAVQEFPSVSVTGLTWAVVEEESDLAYVTISSVSIRDHYWGDDSSEYKTLVELSGQIVSESSLRKKQDRLNNFLSVLSKSKNIYGLRVVDSPAKSAGSSHSVLESAGIFKIHFSIRSI